MLVFCTFCLRELWSVGENLDPHDTHSLREMLVSVEAQRRTSSPALGMTMCLYMGVEWLLVPHWLSSVGLYILTLLPPVPRNHHTGWTVTGSMTFSWNFPITGLMEDKGKTQAKEGWLVCGRRGRPQRAEPREWACVMPQAQPCGHGTGAGPSRADRSTSILPFDLWKFYLMRLVLTGSFWCIPDILTCATH